MKSEERRKQIINLLTASPIPLSGGELSKKLNASRQIIVQDIAVLKERKYEILSTHKGYVLSSTPLFEREFKVKHTNEQTEHELSLIVENGGIILDVFVWHKAYGKLKASMNIFSKEDVKNYYLLITSGKSTELMAVTSGYHYHTVRAETEEQLDKIEKVLDENGYLVPEI